MSRILVTGASGFVGRALALALAETDDVRAAARTLPAIPGGNRIERALLPDLGAPCDFAPLVTGVDTVVHLAAIAHIGPGLSEARYDRVNRAATAELVAAAARAGVGRFVLMSSIRAQAGPSADRILTEDDEPHPTDAYGRSKLAAEKAVRESGVAFTILRPVVIYGPGVKANMASLMRLAALPVPLPFGAFANRRSLLALNNLIDAVRFVLRTPATAGQTYIVADAAPVTLAQIVAAMREARGRRPGLWRVPPGLFRLALRTLGRDDVWQRFGGELVADPAKLMAAGWSPALATPRGLAQMVQAASPLKSGTASRNTR